MLNSVVLDGSHVNGFEEKIEVEIEEDEINEIMYGKRSRGKLGRGKDIYEDDDSQFKSKNLHAERRRRARLSSNLLHLRSIVPIITNMNKEMIVKDAITYIEVMQREVEKLTEVLETEASDPQEERKTAMESDLDKDDEEDKVQIQPEVKLVRIGADKLWMKVIFEKRIGRLTQIMEAIHSFGYQMTDISFTATRGAATFTSCLEEMFGVFRPLEETRDMLLGII